jgi:hypothetical protein
MNRTLIGVIAVAVTVTIVVSYYSTLPKGDLGKRKAMQLLVRSLQGYYQEWGTLPSSPEYLDDEYGLLRDYRSRYRISYSPAIGSGSGASVRVRVNDLEETVALGYGK